jgi:hypothetical protein
MRIPAPAIEELRKQMTVDLLRVQKALWPKVMVADPWATQRLLDCWDRLARLRGLDAPSKRIVQTITQDQVDIEIARLEKELASNDRA